MRGFFKNSGLVFIPLLLSVAHPVWAGSADVSLDVIVADGDPAPGTNGVFVLDTNADLTSSIGIDENAQVFFYSGTNASVAPVFNQRGIWAGTTNYLDDLAIEGQVLPMFQPTAEECEGVVASCGVLFNILADFHVDSSGEVTLRTSREDKNGLVAFLNGDLRSNLAPILKTTDTANFPYNPAIGLKADPGEFVVGPFIGSKAFGEVNGGLTDFVTPFIGGVAPFILDPVTITEIYGTYLSDGGVTFGFNNAADRLFIARLSDNSEALYFDPKAAGPSRLLARTGESTPGIGIGEFVELSQFATAGQTGNARLNDAGQGYFWGSWRNPSAPLNNNNLPRAAIWRFDTSGGPTIVVSEYLNIATDPAFSTSEFPNTVFDNLSVPNVDVNGDIWFFATGRAQGVGGVPDFNDEREGLWRATAGSPIELVLRKSTSDSPGSSLPKGPNVPGTLLSGGERFTGFGLDGYGLDEHGRLLFSTPTAIYAEDSTGIRLVITNGDYVQLAPQKTRTVSLARINTSGHISGQTQAFRDERLAFRVRFTDNSNAILRTIFLDPPPPPELVGLEAVQVVQDWENSVDLFQGKRTIVRAHLRNAEAELVKPRLRVYDINDNELAFSPLAPGATAGLVLAGPESLMKREAKWASANFAIPTAATKAAGLKFKVELIDDDLACEEAAGDLPRDCKLEVTFQEPSKPQLKVVSLNWKAPDNPRVDRRGRMDVVQRIISAYPVARINVIDAEVPFDVDMTIGTSIQAIIKPLKHMKKMRLLDKCTDATGCERLYLGLLRGARILGIGPPSYKAAVGFINSNPRAMGRHTMTHELGHLLNRPHSVAPAMLIPQDANGRNQGPCGSVATVTSARPPFPFFSLQPVFLRATLGPMNTGADRLAYGWDFLQSKVVDPFAVFDLMGYCRANIFGRWSSTWTYSNLATAIGSRYSGLSKLNAGVADQDYWVILGSIVAGTVSLDNLLRVDNSQPPDTSPSGNWQVQALTAGGTVLESSSFSPEFVQASADDSAELFTVSLPVNPLATRIRILDDSDQEVAEIVASQNPPTVNILTPNGGETLAGDSTLLSWQATDNDGDNLSHAVQFSTDAGANWETIAADYSETSITLNNESLTASNNGLFRVITSDGFHQASDDSNSTFTVPESAPTVVILNPGNLRTFYESDPIDLNMAAQDTEDGEISDPDLTWASDLDGTLGNGEELSLLASDLSVGTHVITASAKDSNVLTGTDQITLNIEAQRPAQLADLAVDLVADLLESPSAQQAIVFTAIIEHLGDDIVPTANFSFNATLTALAAYPGPQAVLDDVQVPTGWSCSVNALVLSCSAQNLEAYQRSELSFELTIDRPAGLEAKVEISSAVSEPDEGNNISNVIYQVGRSIIIYRDGFESS